MFLAFASLTGCMTSCHQTMPCTFCLRVPSTFSRIQSSMPEGTNQCSWSPKRSCSDMHDGRSRWSKWLWEMTTALSEGGSSDTLHAGGRYL